MTVIHGHVTGWSTPCRCSRPSGRAIARGCPATIRRGSKVVAYRADRNGSHAASTPSGLPRRDHPRTSPHCSSDTGTLHSSMRASRGSSASSLDSSTASINAPQTRSHPACIAQPEPRAHCPLHAWKRRSTSQVRATSCAHPFRVNAHSPGTPVVAPVDPEGADMGTSLGVWTPVGVQQLIVVRPVSDNDTHVQGVQWRRSVRRRPDDRGAAARCGAPLRHPRGLPSPR
jgi:hypothetical protein